MDKAIFIAMTGASQAMLSQTVHANNLANASTVGFQADFAQQLTQQIEGTGYDSRSYAITENPGTDFQGGTIMTTDRDLDIAVEANGLIAVQAPDGSEAYTRAGNLQLTAEGLLQTADGNYVIGGGGPIALPPAEKISIGSDGTVSVIPQGAESTNLVNIDRIKLVKADPAEMQKASDGLLRMKSGAPAEADAEIQVVPRALTGSNVNAVSEMIQMIDLARTFEVQVKMMETVAQNEQQSEQIIAIS